MHSYFSIGCTASFTPTPNSNPNPGLGSLTEQDLPNRESLRILVIGSRRGVTGTIHTLYRLGFAEVGEWSPLLPAATPGEVMSILTRSLLVDG
ncbi:hypothetical protein H6G89_00120 [Oscillatoria sp. FACHB-1407]|uniref:hypothetical protein n=1 Tax=Oscillatoria sp. FACHB-1407 TaxID=2692847 RepID=UPI00168458FD|nr:hypothetical protein [Oscillatoria sp. FACHB-1407]MBD2459436.1 hypothetical protein [Oscillatoria sp. FACHB-1407]